MPPPCSSMICFTIGNPRPTPITFVLNKGSKIFPISSVTGTGIDKLVFKQFNEISDLRKKRVEDLNNAILKEDKKEKIFRPHLKLRKFEIKFIRTKKEAATGKKRRTFDVTGDRIEQVVKMTDIANEEGLERIYHFMKKMRIKKELQKMGAQSGDKVRIAGKTFIMRP